MEQALDIFSYANPFHSHAFPVVTGFRSALVCVTVLSKHLWKLLRPSLTLSVHLYDLHLMLLLATIEILIKAYIRHASFQTFN